jgi:hypothetical protein
MHHEVLRLQSRIDNLFTLSLVDLELLEIADSACGCLSVVERVCTYPAASGLENARVELNCSAV